MALDVSPKTTETVTVTVTEGNGDTDLTVNSGTLTFTATNWDTPQMVELRAAEEECSPTDPPSCTDDITDSYRYFSVTVDSDINTDWKDEGLYAFESDNDVTGRGLVLSATNVSVPEDGEKTYTVKLASLPNESVTVTVAKKTTGIQDEDLTVDTDPNTTGNQDTLTFTTTDWNTAQTVTLFAADDQDDVNGRAVITHTPAGKWRSAAVDLTATEADNDYVPPRSELVTFGTRTVEDQKYVQDFPIADLTLPAATGGEGNVSYALSGTLPPGLTFDPRDPGAVRHPDGAAGRG